jgi:hypothetical protein
MRDRVFQITGSGVNAIFQDLVIQNGRAADDGSSGASTNPIVQNATRVGGGILNGAGYDINGVAMNGGGSVTLTNVLVQLCQVLGKGDDQVNQHRTLDARGGGIASIGLTGNMAISSSTFTGNSAIGGDGGNFNNGGGSNAQGGSIYIEGGTLNITGSRVLLSSATGGMGGNGPGNQQNGGQGGIATGGGAFVGGTATINTLLKPKFLAFSLVQPTLACRTMLACAARLSITPLLPEQAVAQSHVTIPQALSSLLGLLR